MTIVMLMSNDADIVTTQLNAAWNPITNRFTWAQIHPMNLNIINGATIVVIAHGSGTEIGNAAPGIVDIDAETFLALVQGNMAANAVPAQIYISSCGPGIAEFSANVRITAQNNQIWHNTRIFGHRDSVSGPVPPANDIRWTQIC